MDSTLSPRLPIAGGVAELEPGTSLGRFAIDAVLGRGGFGIVYLASDPELSRKVAIKLLRADRTSVDARARLVREAQAMARLQHPNVLVVYDVGTFRDQVFLAMELVEGETLASWLRTPRDWRAVVAMLAQAGRGLAAAHAAGIVHRDFKPANVLIGADGRPRVCDFGLARPDDSQSREPESAPSVTSSTSTLTESGVVLGTPAYMAPEQKKGEATPLSDQFSFCVALHEGLYGQRPRPGADPPARPRLPRPLRRVVLRGLREDPAARFPSMEALLAALQAAARPGRRLIAAAAVVAVGAGALVAARLGAPDPCGAVDRGLIGVWDDARRDEVRHTFAATRLPYAAATAATSVQLLDRYARAWGEHARAACREAPAAREARDACLEQRRQNLARLVNVLAGADEGVVRGAPEALSGLDDLALCDDPSATSEPMPEDRALGREVLLARAQLAARNARTRMGLYAGAMAELEPLLATARRLGYRPLEAEVLLAEATAQRSANVPDSALPLLIAGREVAEETGYDLLKASAWSMLAQAYGALARFPEAHEAAAYARAVLKRMGREADRLRAALDLNEAHNFALQERFDQALPLALRGFTATSALYPPEDTAIADAMVALANVYGAMNKADLAEPYFVQALARYQRIRGEDHPAVARLYNNLGNVAATRGDNATALERYRRSLAIKEKLSLDDVGVGFALINVGNVLRYMHRCDEALPPYLRALAIFATRMGPQHEMVAGISAFMGMALVEAGRPRDAVSLLRRGVAGLEPLPPWKTELAQARFALARALWETGRDRREARELAEAARAAFAADEGHEAEVEAAGAWLAGHAVGR